jgi:hypothetical protein
MMSDPLMAKEYPNFIESGRDIIIAEMGRDDITVSCTQGKIILWFGRQVTEPLIHQVVFGISNVDSLVVHEHEAICDFRAISEHESLGYTLISYSKTKGGYRTIFNLPFSKKFALDHFVKSISYQLKERDVKKILHWDGSPERIILLFNELKKLDGWEMKRIEYKEA